MTAEFKKSGVGTIEVGQACSIGENVQVVFARPATLRLGDYVTLGDGVKMIIDGGDVSIGDWTTLHADTLVLSKTGVSIGQHCWFGQNTVLDGTGGLTVENGVRIGMYSQLWSHVAAGEQIEGCTLFGERPIHVESDVWLVGSCIVASGVRIGRRTVALIGSNLTKDAPAEVVLAGSPAKVKEGLSFYKSVTLDEKFAMLREVAPAVHRRACHRHPKHDRGRRRHHIALGRRRKSEVLQVRRRFRSSHANSSTEIHPLLRREQALHQGDDHGGTQRIEGARRQQGPLLLLLRRSQQAFRRLQVEPDCFDGRDIQGRRWLDVSLPPWRPACLLMRLFERPPGPVW